MKNTEEIFVAEDNLTFNKLMAYYKCAIMEIETKFNVLNEEFSLQYDRNPINGMKSRLKSLPSIKGKLDKKGLPFTVENIEEKEDTIFLVCGAGILPDSFISKYKIKLQPYAF